MADPLSAIAGVVGVTDFGLKGINSLRHLYRSYKDAPKKLEQLRNEAPADWAAMMHLGQVLDAAAEAGDDNFSRVVFELGEQANAHLIKFEELLANDNQLDPKARQRQSRRSLVGNKLRHIATRWQLRSKHSLALAHKKNFENVLSSSGTTDEADHDLVCKFSTAEVRLYNAYQAFTKISYGQKKQDRARIRGLELLRQGPTSYIDALPTVFATVTTI
ncbi:hypothetical protein G7054_g658 [Neopestalotiopsis clavispora]|nr:hypothetical protein G7054_g658 [Neopestalotiopsis clavispora]